MTKLLPVLGLVLLTALPANAVTFVDENEGGVSRLDIKYATRQVQPESALGRFSIKTYDRWRLRWCYESGCSIVWRLDTRSGTAVDRFVFWYAVRGTGRLEPFCEVYNPRTNYAVGYGKASKWHHFAECAFSKRWMGKTRNIRWRVRTQAVHDSDLAPDVGFYTVANE